MNHGSLFSGIGGFDLAADWMGWNNLFHCEWNEFGQRILKYYWPNAQSYGDITTTDFTIWRGKIDVLSGGFPCQPYSVAGKRLGKEDERHLWPEMLRAIREIQPRWVVGENVFGLINWNGGLVFDEVQADLEAEGYEVQSYVLPACGVDAPHKRDRVWFVAYSNKCYDGRRTIKNEGESREERLQKRNEIRQLVKPGKVFRDASNADSTSIQRKCVEGQKEVQFNGRSSKAPKSRWEKFPTETAVCYGDDGLSKRLDDITFPAWRTKSTEAGGNAVVPQVVLQIFKAIEDYERIQNSRA